MTRASARRSQAKKAKAATSPPDPDLTPPTSPPDPDLTPPVTVPPRRKTGTALDAVQPATGATDGASAPDPGAASAPAVAAGDASAGPATLEAVLHELQMLRATQAQILELLGHGDPAPKKEAGPDDTQMLQPVRSRRRKTVLLVDDDEATRKAALEELQTADVPVRAVEDGNAALAAIADEKPDVIVLELGLAGEMGGKDLINLIKATMAWVDIPVVLWTREGVSTQKEARQIHGADEVVAKSGGPAALVARVISVFRST
jgi:CheY-like chemotaxis protein